MSSDVLDGKYKSVQVRLVCQTIYGRPLPIRTFSDWRSRMEITISSRELTEDEAIRLLVYALLRRSGYYVKDPLKAKKRPVGIGDVQYEILKGRKDQNWQRQIYNLLNEVKNTPEIPLIEPAKGKDLPTVVKSHLGISVSERTIRRLFKTWNMNLCINTTYSIEVIEFVLDHFKKRNYRSAKAA